MDVVGVILGGALLLMVLALLTLGRNRGAAQRCRPATSDDNVATTPWLFDGGGNSGCDSGGWDSGGGSDAGGCDGGGGGGE